MRQSSSSRARHILLVAIAAVLFVVGSRHAVAQLTSNRTVTSATGDWFAAAAWDNGIPNNPGDIAILELAPRIRGTLQLGSSVTLEQLAINGHFSLNLIGSGPLVFRSDGTGDLLLNLSTQIFDLTTILSTPVMLDEIEPLHANVSSRATLQWNGPIVSSAGDLIKQGPGTLRFAGNNTGWRGELVVEDGSVIILNNAALGSLDRGVAVRSGGMLTLEQSTAESLAFDDGTVHVRNITLSGPILLNGTGVIHRPQNPLMTDRGHTFETTLGPTVVSSDISGPGDLVIHNESRDALNLNGQNSHTGHTYITAGEVFATNATSLGTSDGGTTVRGGALTIQAPTGDRFRLEGGDLRLAAGDFLPADPVTIAGGTLYFPDRESLPTRIVVDGPGGGIVGSGSRPSWTGGSTGTGSLGVRYVRVDAPLTHDGDLTVDEAFLNVANSYTGNTFITGDATINHPGAFGRTTTVRVNDGRLYLNVLPDGNPEYVVEYGTLDIPSSLPPITNKITLGGTFDAALTGGATFNGPIHLVSQTSSGRNRITTGVINGQISGDGGVVLGGATDTNLHLNSANDIRGRIELSSGNVHVNHAAALDLTNTVVSRGRLHLNVPTTSHVITNEDFTSSGTVVFNAPQDYAEPWVVNSGAVETSAQVGMSNLIVLNGQVRGLGTGAFRLDGDMRVLRTASIEGGIRGDGDLRLLGSSLSMSGNLRNFTGDVHVHTGTLGVGTLSPGSSSSSLNSNADIHVYDGGSMVWATGSSSSDLIFENDIFLHNAHGANGYQGALVGGARLRGRLDVGDQGSTIAGSFRAEGPLTGRNLSVGYGGLEIVSLQNQLRGVLQLTDQAAVSFDGQGQLHGVDAVILDGGANLYFGPGTATNRLDDATDIISKGGQISLVSGLNAPTSETLGNLKLERGGTHIFVSSDHGSPESGLTINQLARDQGSILRFGQAGFRNTTRIHGVPLEHGMIGPWAVTENGFATLDATEALRTVADTSTTLDTATPADHVYVAQQQSLTSDRTISSLRGSDSSRIDLGGNRLTIRSGGIWRSYEIRNGQLTSGEIGPAELIIHENRGPISADIVDNPGGGSLALVVSGGHAQLSGNNTYTGGTWIVGSGDLTPVSAPGQLIVSNLSAIPANDRVYVDHGIYNVSTIPSGIVRLSELHVRGGGKVRGNSNAPIDADQIVLEEGQFSATLIGDGAIFKETDGSIDFSNDSPSFTGSFTIRDGNVVVNYDTLPQAEFIIEGGQLDVSGNRNAANDIFLRGGTIGDGWFSGNLNVQADSQISHNGLTLFYGEVTGAGDLTIRGRQDDPFGRYVGFFGDASGYSGDIRVESGALRVGSPGNAGTGIITVGEAGRLILGSDDYLDPPTSIENEIHLHGGTLYSTPPWDLQLPGRASRSELTGQVVVHDSAFIGALRRGTEAGVYVPGLTFLGQLDLLDGSHVFGLSDGRSSVDSGDVALVDIAGELRVGADTTWHLLTSTLSISGTIRPNGSHGSIDFVGMRDLLRLNGASFEVPEGQSLAVTINGGALPVAISGSGNSVHGNGTLVGDFTVTASAAIAPGASPGALTLDGETTIGPGGILSIEIGGPQPRVHYDQLEVLGNVALDGALLDVSLLNGYIPSPDDAFIVLRATSIQGVFANARQTIAVGNTTLPVTYLRNIVVLGNAAGVPEPSALAMCGLAAMIIALAFGGRSRRATCQ